MALLAMLTILILILGYWTVWKPYTFYRFYKDLPNTKADFVALLSTFGKSKDYVRDHHDYYHGILQEKRKNPDLKVIGRNIGSTYMLYILDPVYTQDMFTSPDTDIIKHEFQNSFIKTLSPKGLVLSEGKLWKKHRKIFAKGFNYMKVEQSLSIIHSSAKERINLLKSGDTINAMPYFKQIAGGILSKSFFGFDVNEVVIDGTPFPIYLSTLISDLSCEAYSYSFCLLGLNLVKMKVYESLRQLQKRIFKLREAIRAIVKKNVDLRKNKSGVEIESNMWDLFLSSDDPFSEDQMIDEFITFFSDGVYTSGHFMMMTCYYLAMNPEWQQKIREQLVSEDSFKKQDSLHKLGKLGACISETLRLAPPVVTGIERIILHDMTLSKEYPLKKDTMVMACHIVNHLDEKYHDNPLKYDPNRWLTESKTMNFVKKYPGVFMPFSIGVRNCPGQHFAKAEGTIFLAMLIKKFNITMKDGTYKMKFAQKFLREPATSFEILLTEVEK